MDAIIQVMESTIGSRDPYTVFHQQRVSQLACAIASEIGLSENRIKYLQMAGTIHDLGKIAVPAEILNKPGKLTDIEFAMVKSHPQIGFDILKPIKFEGPISLIMLQHHERINGSGYPLGLQGDEILLESRILGVADVVEAMCSHRPYRPALGLQSALEEISRNRGILYDSEVVEACLKLYGNGAKVFQDFLVPALARHPQLVYSEISIPNSLAHHRNNKSGEHKGMEPGNWRHYLARCLNNRTQFFMHAIIAMITGGFIMIGFRGGL